jgi:hypothetical protein
MTDSVDDIKPNLEHDLKTSDQIRTKARDLVYVQHLYAALCNNQFQRRDFWPVLSDQKWSCSWRYAGGIAADLLGKGDYIDWYCSGIGLQRPFDNADQLDSVDLELLDAAQLLEYQLAQQYVEEGTITEEVAADLAALNWYSVPYDPE